MANVPAGRIGRRTTLRWWRPKVVNMITVYAIKSLIRNYIYAGMTNDLERRLHEHNNGENKSTNACKPFIWFYSETFPDRASASTKEKFLKLGVGKEFLRSLKI